MKKKNNSTYNVQITIFFSLMALFIKYELSETQWLSQDLKQGQSLSQKSSKMFKTFSTIWRSSAFGYEQQYQSTNNHLWIIMSAHTSLHACWLLEITSSIQPAQTRTRLNYTKLYKSRHTCWLKILSLSLPSTLGTFQNSATTTQTIVWLGFESVRR